MTNHSVHCEIFSASTIFLQINNINIYYFILGLFIIIFLSLLFFNNFLVFLYYLDTSLLEKVLFFIFYI